jgi:hypothetical protein
MAGELIEEVHDLSKRVAALEKALSRINASEIVRLWSHIQTLYAKIR